MERLPAGCFLGPQTGDGKRSLKAFEMQLTRLGRLPSGDVLAPAERVKLDRYGNVSRDVLTAT